MCITVYVHVCQLITKTSSGKNVIKYVDIEGYRKKLD